jgi:hypothetical protein
VVEELPGRAARLAAEHVVTAAAQHHRSGWVGIPDGPEEGLQLGDVLNGGAGPQQVGVARLVVALPVPHAPPAVAHHPANELPVRALVVGGRLRLEVGRHPGAPRRAGAQGDPHLLIAVQLCQQRVHHLPLVAAGLGLHLPPVQVRPDQAGPEGAGLWDELTGLAEQAVADAAHHAQPDPRRVKGTAHGHVGGHRGCLPLVKVYVIYLTFISYT